MAAHLRTSLFLALASFALLGCTKYYEIVDQETGKVYYTAGTDKPERKDGTLAFQDAMSGQRITLDDAEVREIKDVEYDYHVYRYGAVIEEE